MKFIFVTFALVASVLAGGSQPESGKTCGSGQSVVCKDNGNGGLITLGNVAPGALGESCAGGDVYCCDDNDVASGLVNLNVNAQCSLNHLL